MREDIEINLVDIDTCRATLRAIIEREGQEIYLVVASRIRQELADLETVKGVISVMPV